MGLAMVELHILGSTGEIPQAAEIRHQVFCHENQSLPLGPSPSRRAVAVGRAAIFIHHGPRDSEYGCCLVV